MEAQEIIRHLLTEAVRLNEDDPSVGERIESSLRDSRVQELLEWLCRKDPDLKVRWKLESRLWKRLPKMRARSFRARGNTIWLPDPKTVAAGGPLDWLDWLSHEGAHVVDGEVAGWDGFLVMYAFPQWLALPLAIVAAICAVVGADHVTAVFGIAAGLMLLPWPSASRAGLEVKAYASRLAVERFVHGPGSEQYEEARKDTVVDLTSWMYYKMIWRKKTAWKYVDRIEGSIGSGRPGEISSVVSALMLILEKNR